MNRGSHLAYKALRALIADAASDEDFRRARRFAELNGLDYADRTPAARGTSAAGLRLYLDGRSVRRSVA
jgi:hypothetical protein